MKKLFFYLVLLLTAFAGFSQLASIKITDAPDGTEITTLTTTTDGNVVLYASGYDSGGIYIGLQVVDWGFAGSVFFRQKDFSGWKNLSSTTFIPDNIGVDQITIVGAFSDSTGNITVNPGAVDSIVIENATGGTGSSAKNRTMTTLDTLTIFAIGYDADGNYVEDVLSTWSSTGTLEAIAPGPSTSLSFSPTIDGTQGTIIADDGAAHIDATGTVRVNASPLTSVMIRDAAGGLGNEVTIAN